MYRPRENVCQCDVKRSPVVTWKKKWGREGRPESQAGGLTCAKVGAGRVIWTTLKCPLWVVAWSEIQEERDGFCCHPSSNWEVDEEVADKFEEKSKEQNSRNNLRSSLQIKEIDNSFQNIIITKEKLENLSKQTKIPLIQESDYTFLNEIGEGTYGEVFLVESNSISEQYAMKKIICKMISWQVRLK